MTNKLAEFLDELAQFMADAADVEYEETPRALWLYEMEEKDSTLAAGTPAPASVLRVYDGETPAFPVDSVSIQCTTTATKGDDESGLLQAQALQGALRHSDGRPLRMASLTHFRINAVSRLGVPGQIARDVNERALIVFNFDVEYVVTS